MMARMFCWSVISSINDCLKLFMMITPKVRMTVDSIIMTLYTLLAYLKLPCPIEFPYIVQALV